MLDSYVGWDVTDFVKAKAAEGAKNVTFRVSTPYQWRALSRFTSSESTTNPGKGPQMLVALDRSTSGVDAVSEKAKVSSLSVCGHTLRNPSGKDIVVFTPQGMEVLRGACEHIDLSSLPQGIYVACGEGEALKFAVN